MNARMTTTITPDGSSAWARARLRLGQANVGTWVVLAVAWWATGGTSLAWGPSSEAGMWAAWVALGVLAQAPFDGVGGYILPVRHGRRDPGFGTWLVQWARGVGVHGLVLWGAGVLVMAAAQAAGWAAAALVVVAVTLVLLMVQQDLLRLSADVSPAPLNADAQRVALALGLDPSRVDVVETPERGFVGGWLGLPGFERLVVPVAWTRDGKRWPVIVTRRLWARTSGARVRGVVGAVAFQWVGWAAVSWLVGAEALATAHGMVSVGAGVTLWGFVGLLTLPRVSRRAVHAIDRAAASTLSPELVGSAIRRLDVDQEDEGNESRSERVGAIYHPVPTPERRIAALRDVARDDARAAWRITRMALFLGWATGSWLSRAVHCNIGRPELWVVLPGD